MPPSAETKSITGKSLESIGDNLPYLVKQTFSHLSPGETATPLTRSAHHDDSNAQVVETTPIHIHGLQEVSIRGWGPEAQEVQNRESLGKVRSE